MVRYIVFIGVALIAFATGATAQRQPYSMLDNRPYDPERDPDIDMYMGSWTEAMPRHSHGCLVERDILTTGDPKNPVQRGAVLTCVEVFAYATLQPGETTVSTEPDGVQEIFYVLSGEGRVQSAKTETDLYPGIGVLVPEGVEFTITASGGTELAMYYLVEKCPDGFSPQPDIVFRDENAASWNEGNPHWVGLSKPLFSANNGLATIGNIITVRFDPMTFFQPHSHSEGQEEVWTTIYGDAYFLLGKEIRRQPPGTAYLVPPTGITAHSNFNVSESMIKFFYFATLN